MKSYFKNGSISFKGTFVNDKAIGVTKEFFESGKIYAKNYFDNGEYLKREVFDENRKIKSIYYPKTGETISK